MIQLTGKAKGFVYCRLSRDEDGEKESLKNQEDIVVDYLNENGHEIVDIAKDDNYSGMNFNRPGIERMMELVNEKKIDTVFVKDVSRLGRHLGRTTICIEELKEKGIRVISVSEKLDSFCDTDEMTMRIQSFVNDSYARDIQRKVIYGLRQKQKSNGLIITPPMGYFKDKNTNEIIIVEEAAQIIRDIYKMYLDGYGFKAIAKILNERGVKSPSYYSGKMPGENKPKISSKFLWDYTAIKRILTSEFYCGTVVNHKQERSRITKRQVNVPKEEQFRHEGIVPVIITRDIWERVQALMKEKERKNVRAGQNKVCHKYAGLLECADCGCSFVAKIRRTKNNPDRIEYVCNGYNRYSDMHCTSHKIREEVLDDIVNEHLMYIRFMFKDLWENVEEDVKKWAAGKNSTEKRIETLQNMVEKAESEIKQILMERIQDKKNADMYDEMIDERREDIENWNKEISEIVNMDKTIKDRKASLKQTIAILDEIIKDNSLSNTTLHMLIDKIIIQDDGDGLNLDIKVKSPIRNSLKAREYISKVITVDYRKFNTFEQAKVS